MKKLIILGSVAILAMTGCADNKEISSAADSQNAIEFRPVVEKTRASLIGATSELTNFFVHASIDEKYDFGFLSAAVYNDGTAWTYAPKKYYPADGTPVSFYAYAPIKDVNMTTPMAIANDGNDANKVTFSYTVPADQSVSNTAADLLVSTVGTHKASDGNVVFTFDHALSAVSFSARNLNDVDSELVYVIQNVEITELCTKGTYTYGTGASAGWTVQTTPVTYKPGVSASGMSLIPGGATAAYANLLSANDVMMVLPQEIATFGELNADGTVKTNGTFVVVTYNLKSGDGQYIYPVNTKLYLELPNIAAGDAADFEFEAGQHYNFQFSFKGLDAIVLDVDKVNDWVPAPTVL